MKISRKIFLVLVAAAILCAPSVQAAQLVLNGGFELSADPVGPGYTTNAPTSWVALTGTEPVFRGNNPGTYGDNKVFLIAPGNFGFAVDGSTWALSLQASPNNYEGARQILGPMVAGARYDFSGQIIGNNDITKYDVFLLNVSKNRILAGINESDFDPVGSSVMKAAFSYTATGADTGDTLALVARGRAGGVDVFPRALLDNVTVGVHSSAPSVTSNWTMEPFVKNPKPVLLPDPEFKFQCPIMGKVIQWEEQNVYNPAAVVRDGKVYLFYRADDRNPAIGWGRTCRIGMAWSEDGTNFTKHPTPVLYPDNDEWKQYEWEGGCEDLHIVEGEDGVYYMNYTTWNGSIDTMSIASSKDLMHWTKHGPAFRKFAPDKTPGSRSGVVLARLVDDQLVAARINGKYWMYYTHPCALAWSDNLIDWTPANKSVWPTAGHESGAIALLRNDGILLMTQGPHPSLGSWTLRQALVDRNDLVTLLEDVTEPFLFPEYEWEKAGSCANTTVANTLVPFKGKWMLYYGGADRVIGLATCPMEK